MARTGFIHHIGTFFLFAATVLLIITDISAPVVSDISLLKVELGTNRRSNLFNNEDDRFPTVTFGTFGYCITDLTSYVFLVGETPTLPSTFHVLSIN
ncbi:hypothetical protein ONZ43_g4688 [Nemania bipapillata]|uniref:Uncharacterized protein n=1 Tax=Nemania bipapillata TaxID=110536 RepID=A0ACC2IJP4_9PEZI|nr:hypothetical protein ONZ43_g4688 [Nemania bipapillata]